METKTLFNKHKIFYFTTWKNHYKTLSYLMKKYIPHCSLAEPVLSFSNFFTILKYKEERKRYYLIDYKGDKRLIAGIIRDDNETVEKVVFAAPETFREAISRKYGKDFNYIFTNDGILFYQGEFNRSSFCRVWNDPVIVNIMGSIHEVESFLEKDIEGNKAIVIDAKNIANILIEILLKA